MTFFFDDLDDYDEFPRDPDEEHRIADDRERADDWRDQLRRIE